MREIKSKRHEDRTGRSRRRQEIGTEGEKRNPRISQNKTSQNWEEHGYERKKKKKKEIERK